MPSAISLAVKRGDGGADNSANLVCLLGGGGETCSDCPNGLICDNDIFDLLGRKTAKSDFDLHCHKLGGNALLALFLIFADAEDSP